MSSGDKTRAAVRAAQGEDRRFQAALERLVSAVEDSRSVVWDRLAIEAEIDERDGIADALNGRR